MEISVLLVDDQPMFRKGLRMMLDEEENIRVVGEAGDGEEAVLQARKLSPDVVVMDITMPNVDGIEATRRIVSELPDVKVIPLSIHSGKRFVENMLRAGAAGYVLKESVPEELVNAVRTVHQGNVFLSSAISGVVVSEYVRLLSRTDGGKHRGELTENEEAMLPLIAEGHSVKEIAAALDTSASAARSTQRRIIRKLGFHDVAELTEYTRANRWAKGEVRVDVATPPDAGGVTSSMPILGTKFHRPIVPPDFVSRKRLLDQLEKGRKLPMTLVSAPAGYGKSTLVADWLAKKDEGRTAWLSLGEEDNDLRSFLTYFVAAVNVPFPKACPDTTALLQATQMPSCSVLANALTNGLDAIDGALILVLDDYHRIANADIHELLDKLLRYPPRPLHLVVITRHDPPFSLAALRAHGWVTEIRQDDLHFCKPEVSAVLKQMTGISLSDTALEHLEENMEGWIVGLHLLALLLHNETDPEAFLSDLKGGFQQVHDYLVEEVLSKQPAAVRDFLLQTSLLDRFCAPLVEAISFPVVDPDADRMTGENFIQALVQANLFVVPLDARGHWFRFHHLFQDLLQWRLERSRSRDEITALHSRASEWFEAEGLVDEALQYALLAEDVEWAAQIVQRHARPVMNEGRWHIVARWLSVLPDSVVQQQPELLLIQAWKHHYYQNFGAILPLLDRIDSLIGGDPEEHNLSGEVAVLRGYFALFFQGDSARSFKYLTHALDNVPVENSEFRALAEFYFGAAGQMEGQTERITQQLADWLNEVSPDHSLRESYLAFGLMFVHYLSGDLEEAQRYLERTQAVASSHGLENMVAWSGLFGGLIHLKRGEYDSAISFLEQAVKSRYHHFARGAICSLAALTLTYQAYGQPERAAATLQTFREFTSDLGPPFAVFAASCAVRLSLMQGQRDAAVRWLRETAPLPAEVMLCYFEMPNITRCRALIAEGSAGSLKEAEERLREYAEQNEAQHNTIQLIELLPLQAVAFGKQDKPKEAQAVLERAVELAQPSRIIFPFVECGPPMTDLLGRLRTQNVAVEFIDRLLAAFPEGQPDVEIDASPPLQQVSHLDRLQAGRQTKTSSRSPDPQTGIQPVLESLTHRELDTLELLAERLYDKEIAKALSISIWTVKSHLKHLFEKLQVHNRRQAVLKAEELGLLKGK